MEKLGKRKIKMEKLGKIKVLYVEYEASIREIIQRVLNNLFEIVDIAKNGEEAFKLFKKNNYDLVITDINMPKMDGLTLAKKIKEISPFTSIILISASDDNSFLKEAIKIKVDGFLIKPIDLDELMNVLTKVVLNYLSHQKEELLKAYQKAVDEVLLVSKTDTKGIITYANDAFCEISGYTKEELIGKPHNIVRHPDMPKEAFENLWKTIKSGKSWRGIVKNKKKNGKPYFVDTLIIPLYDKDGNIKEYLSIRHDITEIMNPLKQLTLALNNFKNKVLVYAKLQNYDDMEEFYDFDTLNKFEEKLTEVLAEKFSKFKFDRVYYLANGEYAIIFEENPEEIIKFTKSLKEKLKTNIIKINEIDMEIYLMFSIVYEGEKVLESAKFGIKHLIKEKKEFIIANNLAITIQQKAKENIKTINLIKNAIENHKIVSYFQPIVDNKTKQITKYESLVRLINNECKVLTPYFFLEVAKKSAYYEKITAIMLENSFRVLDFIKNADIDISVNISFADIEQVSTRKKIFSLLKEYKSLAHHITFELLEDENIKDDALVKSFIKAIKKYGATIAIDDFGIGYSNFTRLMEYHPDILKIDGSLIKNIDKDEFSYSVVKSIVTFAKEQNLKTIAEFVEDETIFNIIKDLGIDYSQGYYFGKPEPEIKHINS